MTTSQPKPAAFLPLAKLASLPASDLKKLGWRGVMNALRSKGRLLVTNHDEPRPWLFRWPNMTLSCSW